jgi:hypothetical protein
MKNKVGKITRDVEGPDKSFHNARKNSAGKKTT